MEIYRQITVDLYNPYPLAIMNAKQGDTARGALISLTCNGEILVPTTESVQIYATKPDGTKIYNTCMIVGNQIQVKFTDQMLALPGHLPVEIEMIDGQDILSTPIFIINVLPTNIDANAIESTNEFTALQTAITEAATYKTEYLKKPDAVLDSTQASTDSNTGHLEFQGKPFYPEIPVKQIQNFSYGKVDFETAAEREEISTGETLSSLFGKAKKWFSDLASGAASTLLGKNLDINRALITDSSGKVAASDVSSTELGYLKNAQKNIQEQIGTISGLNTEEKGSIVGAINELNSNINNTWTEIPITPIEGNTGEGKLYYDQKDGILKYGINLSLYSSVTSETGSKIIGTITSYPFNGSSIIIPCKIGQYTGSQDATGVGFLEITNGLNVMIASSRSFTYTPGATYSIGVVARNF